MAAELIFAPEAEQDIAEAYGWYERQRVGLSEDFLSWVDACIQTILRSPESRRLVHEDYRRAFGADIPLRRLLRVCRRRGHGLLRVPHVARPGEMAPAASVSSRVRRFHEWANPGC
jgi:plasmid stabilization system protein ParE